jgi:tellurite resistance protein TerC
MTPTLLAAKANFVDIDVPLWAWGALLVFIILLLLVDLVVFHKEAHDVKTREAAIESIVWVSIGLAFTFVVWFAFSGAAAGEYISGYLIEKSRCRSTTSSCGR